MSIATAMGRDSQCLQGIRVLVVDDDADVRDTLLSILRLFGADAVAAECADDARALLAVERFDVLLSDIEMPYENGLELIRGVRRSRACSIPVAAVTARVSAADYRAALAAGFDCVLAKPFDIASLVDVVRELAHGALPTRVAGGRAK